MPLMISRQKFRLLTRLVFVHILRNFWRQHYCNCLLHFQNSDIQRSIIARINLNIITMAEPEVSHGRGGAGNIGADSTQYVDGEIVRQGPAGDHGDGAFSVGRGGAANIGSPGLPATKRSDADSIPDAALRPSTDGEVVHFGRGGEGNVVNTTKPGVQHPVGLADKLKNKLFKKKAHATEK